MPTEKVIAEWSAHPRLKLFEKSWTQQVKWRELAACLGPMTASKGLDIGGLGGCLSHALRQAGGSWRSADVTKAGVEAIREILGEEVALIRDAVLPFKDGQFDVVVVVERMETMPDEARFVAECHRVLKTDGRLIILTPNMGAGRLLRAIRRMLKLEDDEHRVRPGYTSARLYATIKDGFDVEESGTYSRILVETIQVFVDLLERRIRNRGGYSEMGADPEETIEKIYRLYQVFYPIFWLASGFDALLFFARGRHLIARARRRIWRPRRTPVLHDGRSIADAAINTKIGTAAPF